MRFQFILAISITICTQFAVADFDTAADAYRNKDYVGAYQQFLKLAEQGDPRAQTVLAMMHKFGESVPIDLEQSFQWYKKAAEAGYAPAQYNVGTMYADGKGTGVDREQAIEWLTRAAKAGFDRANDRLSALDAEMVMDGKEVDNSIPWSKSWNFRLPNQIRFGNGATAISNDLYRVQLGAMRTQAAANRLWDSLAGAHGDLFRSLSPRFPLSESNGQRIYRVQAGPFDNFRDARAFCDELVQRAVRSGCLPLRQ